MNNLFAITVFISLISIIVFAILTLVNFIKDKNKVSKPSKRLGISIVFFVLFFILFGVTRDKNEVTTDREEKVETAAPVKEENAVEKQAREVKVTVEKQALEAKNDEEKAIAEQKAKEEKEKKLADEQNHYINDIKPHIDKAIIAYDSYWSEIWKPTFEGLGISVNLSIASNRMKMLDNNYRMLDTQISKIKGSQLSEENKKIFEEYISSMRAAATARRKAAQNAQAILDKGIFSPSEMDSLETDIDLSDSHAMNALTQLTTLESALGVKR